MSKPVKFYVDPRTPVVDEMIEEYGQSFERMTTDDRIFLISEISLFCHEQIWSECSGRAIRLSEDFKKYGTN